MNQNAWAAAFAANVCPVSDELIGELYRAPLHGINDIVSAIPIAERANLAAFCYGRAHLRDIGLAIAATCDRDILVATAGRVGNFLYDLSRELPSETKPRSWSQRAKITLAPIKPASPLETMSSIETESSIESVSSMETASSIESETHVAAAG